MHDQERAIEVAAKNLRDDVQALINQLGKQIWS
jgi:hypothetical protein